MSVSIRKPARWAVVGAVTALVAACAAGPQVPPPRTGPETGNPGNSGTPSSNVDPLAPYESSGHAAMDAWRASFAARASADGRDPAVIRAILEGISPLDIFLGNTVSTASAVEDQAEFAKPIWEYLRTAVSETRRVNGAELLAGTPDMWSGLENRYGVDRGALTAIWGMETNFGSYIGTFDAANTLANMAVEGRRRGFAEGELLALMKIVERGEAARGDLISGWAGAMGQTQFMPSTYLAHAADFDGDGRKDVWKNTGDALASAGNYLSVSGYEFGQPWGLEVTLPEDFDYSLADGRERRVESWQSQGVTIVDTARGAAISDGKFGELWVPAGHRGPKFLLFKNFNVFKTYNRADSYALAVGLLSDAVTGRPALSTPWPRDLQPLSVAQVKQLQAALNDLGHDAGPVDGIAGRGTKGALRRFQAANGFIADGFPTTEMLSYVLAAAG
ncbi:MAG: lytic murein transglycosylase [Hyphomonadaceae bacterium]|nr:lytic murein transglycosylase [Hyphomonadaceae bacterium]